MIIAQALKNQSREAARRIGTDLLAKATEALLNGNFDTYAECFDFPTRLETFEGNRMICSPAELLIIFDDIRNYLSVNNVTDLVRKFVEAEFVEPGILHFVHESYLLNHATLLKQPVPVLSVIKRINGAWKVTKSAYAIPHSDELGNALIPKTT